MRLRQLREEKHESQQKLAMILNISQAMISRYELGQGHPDINTLKVLAEHYGVTVDYLIGYSDSRLPLNRSDFSETEQEALFMLRKLNFSQREKAIAYIKGLLDD